MGASSITSTPNLQVAKLEDVVVVVEKVVDVVVEVVLQKKKVVTNPRNPVFTISEETAPRANPANTVTIFRR